MKSLLIVGAGGYGQVVKEVAESEYQHIDFLDDNHPEAVGRIDALEEIQNRYDGVIVAIGNPNIRKRIFQKIEKPVSIIHPRAVVSKSAKVGLGCVIEANSVINHNADIKEACFVCAGAVVNHDAMVNGFCQIDCNAVVESDATVPEGTKVESCTVFRRI